MQQVPKLQINLASEPFRKDRFLLVASSVLAALMCVMLAFLVVTVVKERNAARESRAQMDGLQNELNKLTAEQAKLMGQLRLPANASVLDKSAFINSLLVRKGISWTRMFSDLSEVFPYNVRLISVRPFVTADNRIQLEMSVAAQSPAPVVELLQHLEASALFENTLIQAEQPPSQNEPLFRFRVSVNYAQKL